MRSNFKKSEIKENVLVALCAPRNEELEILTVAEAWN